MCININKLIITSATLIPLLTAGCSDEEFKEPDVEESLETLTVTPAMLNEIGFYEKIVFEIKLKDQENAPLADVPVLVSLIGEAHNADLAPGKFNTSAEGTGQVTFIAPDKEASFEIRFKSPESEVYVPVTVDPTIVSLSLSVDYPGQRTLSTMEASLYEMTSDFNCNDLTASPLVDASIYHRAVTPMTFSFFGLREDQLYGIVVTGNNSAGEVRASGCVTDLVPNQQNDELVLVDTPLNATGTFDIITEFDTGGAIDVLVDQLAENIDFADSPARAIFDSIGKVLAENDPFAEEAFNQQREDNAWDQLLASAYFEKQDVDVAGAIQPIWERMKSSMNGFTAIGSFELEISEADDEDDYNLYHEITLLQFPRAEGDDLLDFPIEVPDMAVGAARDGSHDSLLIISHQVHLGLGEPLHFLFIDALQSLFNESELSEALEAIVDCTAVAEFLEEPLSDVAVRSTIEEGCRIAAVEANGQAVDQVTELSQYDLITFRGSCSLEVPFTGNRVDNLESGEFFVTWGNDLGEQHSMKASFEAHRTQQK
jgi:hypothetical protein